MQRIVFAEALFLRRGTKALSLLFRFLHLFGTGELSFFLDIPHIRR